MKNPHPDFGNVAIVGGGTMGCSIAAWMLLQQCRVTLVCDSIAAAEEAEASVRAMIKRREESRDQSPADTEMMSGRLQSQTDMAQLGGNDLVIEAVTEDMGFKRNVFAALKTAVSEKTIISSNTSSIEISVLADMISAPGRVMGTHFFYPVTVNPVVEVIRGRKTDPTLARKVRRFFTETGKTAIASQDSPGFVVNRYFNPYMNTAHWLMDKLGVSGATIDEVGIRLFESRQGPIEVSNWIGNKQVYSSQKNLGKLGKFYHPTAAMHRHGIATELTRLGDVVPLSDAQITYIQDTLMGCVFFPCLQLLDEQEDSATDIDQAARLSLRFNRPPCTFMDELGKERVAALIQPIIDRHGEGTPLSLERVGQLCNATAS